MITPPGRGFYFASVTSDCYRERGRRSRSAELSPLSEGLTGSLIDLTKDQRRQGRSPLANSTRTRLAVMNSTTVNASPSSTVNAPDRTWCLALRVPSTDLPRMYPKKKHVTSRSQYKWVSRQRVRPVVPMTGREGLARLRLRQWTPEVEELELPGKIWIFPPRRRLGIERHTALRAAMARLREHGLTVYR